MSRRLFLSSNVSQSSMQTLVEKILEFEREDEDERQRIESLGGSGYKPEPISIYIDSYGGDVYACLGLLSVMNLCTTPIRTIVTGCAMSCGFLIAIHGHERYAYPDATLMYHQVSYSQGYDTVKSIGEGVKEGMRIQERIEAMTLKRTKLKKAQLTKVRDSKQDLYMTAREALKLGVIDTICKGNLL